MLDSKRFVSSNSRLFDDDTAIRLNHDLCLTVLSNLQGFLDRSEELLTLLLWLVGEISHGLACKHRQVEGQGKRLVCSIQTANKPFACRKSCTRTVQIASLASYYRILRRITAINLVSSQSVGTFFSQSSSHCGTSCKLLGYKQIQFTLLWLVIAVAISKISLV